MLFPESTGSGQPGGSPSDSLCFHPNQEAPHHPLSDFNQLEKLILSSLGCKSLALASWFKPFTER